MKQTFFNLQLSLVNWAEKPWKNPTQRTNCLISLRARKYNGQNYTEKQNHKRKRTNTTKFKALIWKIEQIERNTLNRLCSRTRGIWTSTSQPNTHTHTTQLLNTMIMCMLHKWFRFIYTDYELGEKAKNKNKIEDNSKHTIRQYERQKKVNIFTESLLFINTS